MDTNTLNNFELIVNQGKDITAAYVQALQKQLTFSQCELEEQYAVNQELIDEKIWLMAYLYAFLIFFQMSSHHVKLDEFLLQHKEFINAQRAFILEDFTHEHKDLHNLNRFCKAVPTDQP